MSRFGVGGRIGRLRHDSRLLCSRFLRRGNSRGGCFGRRSHRLFNCGGLFMHIIIRHGPGFHLLLHQLLLLRVPDALALFLFLAQQLAFLLP